MKVETKREHVQLNQTKIDFKPKMVLETEGNYTMIKGQFIKNKQTNIYASNFKAIKYIKQVLTEDRNRQ